MKERTQIRLDPAQREKLDALSLRSGQSVAALIRWCIEKSLPTLQENIDRNLRTYQYPSTNSK